MISLCCVHPCLGGWAALPKVNGLESLGEREATRDNVCKGKPAHVTCGRGGGKSTRQGT